MDYRYRDPGMPLEQRLEILLSQMTLQEKAGLLFHSMVAIGPEGHLTGENPDFGLPSTETLVLEKGLTHFNALGGAPDGATLAAWNNRLQHLASSTRLGIPITLSTDPRHSYSDNPGTAVRTGAFSKWPEPLGLAAIGDEQLVEKFGDIARREYLAVGLRLALHPQLDLATEPRWSRQIATFGEDAELSGRLGAAYIRGFQGPTLGDQSVSTMTKHFPGGGPQKDGEDPHFDYGREQVYPGNNFEYHLRPFHEALRAGTSQIMPYYGMPVETQYEEVGFGFNKSVITDLLRTRFQFDGVVCTDWGILTDAPIYGHLFPARAWGVENLTPLGRLVKALDAGVDQFGGEFSSELVVEAVEAGLLSEDRVDVSARRILREKFTLGLFENPLVDELRANEVVGNAAFREAGQAAQAAAITVLTNTGSPSVLPLKPGIRIYAEGVTKADAARYGTVVERPEDAEVALLRLEAPWEQRATRFEQNFHAGSLDFDDAEIARVMGIASNVPTVIDVYLDRPAILTPFVDAAAALTVNFGANAQAFLDVVFGKASPRGRLPMDLPSSTHAIEQSKSDVPFDTESPLFRFGHGLSLS